MGTHNKASDIGRAIQEGRGDDRFSEVIDRRLTNTSAMTSYELVCVHVGDNSSHVACPSYFLLY